MAKKTKPGTEPEVDIEEQMANLHNRFVAYISEARTPLPFVITVLELLLHEAREQAIKKYLGG